ncbi:MAG: aminotransferase class I/II-fold pyridoxal phosphate-dependent enzyme [Treponemataceae bacterium]|nr:aminotransferase class I/II-fold pyridoxal phosphate-dependent enzyme [Treponemataceae bacterium]
MIHFLAQELNDVLKNTVVDGLLSDMGKRMFFPKGIIAQSGEAKKLGKKANATIGITVNDGIPVWLPAVQRQLPSFSSSEAVAYAPTAGNPKLRELWKIQMIAKNPDLQKKLTSLPVVVPGLTAGISYICDLFLSEGENLLACDPSWDNYQLVCETRRNANLVQFQMFWGDGFEGGFNVDAFKKAINEEAKKNGKVCVILNFPQNPSGYSPTVDEAKAICQAVKECADTGAKMLVICDDAYFGLAYEDNIEKQSLFAYLADIHENVLAVKIDGPTKEDYVWGFRCGFLTFANKVMTEEEYEALVKKLMGVIRSSVSCCATPSQTILLKAFSDPKIEEEKAEFRQILEGRYRKARNFLNTKKDCKILVPMPFNSGYFMSLRCNGIDAEELRQKLLKEYEVGTIAIDSNTLRIAFSSLDKRDIEPTYQIIYKAAEELAGAKA